MDQTKSAPPEQQRDRTNLITAVDLLRFYLQDHDMRSSEGTCICTLCLTARQLAAITPTRIEGEQKISHFPVDKTATSV